jgi:chromosome partitioning protein
MQIQGGTDSAMRTVAIINQKGGCGKTTVALNLAATLAQQGASTLLADMDPQGHCALGLSVPEKQIESSMAELLTAGLDGSTSVAESAWQVARRLDLLPATMNLAGVEQRLAQAADKDRRLTQVLATVQGRYQFCIIDCPPSIGLLTFNALRAADEVIVPVETGYFALQGALKQQQTIEMLARRVAHRVRLHMLATMYDPGADHARPIFTELQRQFGDYMLPATIHYSARLQQAASVGQSIVEYAPDSHPARDFANLGHWLSDNPPQSDREPVVGQRLSEAFSSVGQPEPAGGSVGRSRAAELVDRARQLSERTAQLSAKLNQRSRNEGIATGPSQPTSSGAGESAGSDRAPTRPSQPHTPEPGWPWDGQSRVDNDLGNQRPGNNPLQPVADDQPQAPAAHSPQQAAGAFTQTSPPPESAGPADTGGETATVTRPANRLQQVFGVRGTNSGLLFVQPIQTASQVAVVGDFNNWDPQATPLRRDDRLGVWQGCVPVPAGRYRYQLVVDGRWLADPYNAQVDTDEQGQLQSIAELQR